MLLQPRGTGLRPPVLDLLIRNPNDQNSRTVVPFLSLPACVCRCPPGERKPAAWPSRHQDCQRQAQQPYFPLNGRKTEADYVKEGVALPMEDYHCGQEPGRSLRVQRSSWAYRRRLEMSELTCFSFLGMIPLAPSVWRQPKDPHCRRIHRCRPNQYRRTSTALLLPSASFLFD